MINPLRTWKSLRHGVRKKVKNIQHSDIKYTLFSNEIKFFYQTEFEILSYHNSLKQIFIETHFSSLIS